MEPNVFIGLGTNQGDRELNLLRAVAEVGKISSSRITALSGFYDTEPVGPVAQDNFLNAVLRLETELSPYELLSELQRLENEVFRRRRMIKWGPRSMDMDILLYGDAVINREDLVIPHPQLHERRFVLIPLAEIAPETIHPLFGKSITELLKSLPAGERVTRITG